MGPCVSKHESEFSAFPPVKGSSVGATEGCGVTSPSCDAPDQKVPTLSPACCQQIKSHIGANRSVNGRNSNMGVQPKCIGPKGRQMPASDGSSRQQQRPAAAIQPFSAELELLREVQELQQKLALVSSAPVLGLKEACYLVAGTLGADMACMHSFLGAPGAVLVAAWGLGADALESCPVRPWQEGDDDASAKEATGSRAGGAAGPEADPLPAQMQLLRDCHGLRSFTRVPIGPPAAPLGTLTLGKLQAGALDDERLQVWLHAASMGVLRHLRHPQVSQMCGLLWAMDEAPDAVATISVLLQGASRFLSAASGLRVTARLALLQHPGTVNTSSEALLFEAAPDYSSLPAFNRGPSHSEVVSASDVESKIVAGVLPLDRTLLASAVAMQQARFIKDCATYIQTCPTPARDLFSPCSGLVASVVLIPLVAGPEGPFGALYFALDKPCDFEAPRDTMLGFVSGVTGTLHSKLAGNVEALGAMVAQASPRASSSPSAAVPLTGDTLPSDGSASAPKSGPKLSSFSDTEGSCGMDPSSARTRHGQLLNRCPVRQGQLSRSFSQKFNLEAMLQLIQSEVRTGWRRAAELSCVPELAVGQQIGIGAFGVVHRGYWHRVPVAVKIMCARSNEREAMNDAVEMAVLSTAQHPNIVQVYACLTDMVEVAGDGSGSYAASGSMMSNSSCSLRYRRLQPDQDTDDIMTCNLLVMEYCDRGTLRDVISSGALHPGTNGGAGPAFVDVVSCVEVLLDVACAVGYLHAMQLVHGDIKLDNILMKSDASRRLGMTPKLGDFGTAGIVGGPSGDCTGAFGGRRGAAAHLAPEALAARACGGGRPTAEMDAYSFGILMWELFMGRRAFEGMDPEEICNRVCRTGRRPSFPPGAPRAYADLAAACWSADPSERPPFNDIISGLEGMLAATPGSGSAPPPGMAPS